MKRPIFRGSDKHTKPWQQGRKGSLCPEDIDRRHAQALLDASEMVGKQRYAVFAGRAYCAQSDDHGTHWHGYPVGWKEVPPRVWHRFLKDGKVSRRDLGRYWEHRS